MSWFSRKAPTPTIPRQTLIEIHRYLMKEAKERTASADPKARADSTSILLAASKLLGSNPEIEPAILSLKGLRKSIQRVIPALRVPQLAAEAIAEVARIETMLKDLGVTNFDV